MAFHNDREDVLCDLLFLLIITASEELFARWFQPPGLRQFSFIIAMRLLRWIVVVKFKANYFLHISYTILSDLSGLFAIGFLMPYFFYKWMNEVYLKPFIYPSSVLCKLHIWIQLLHYLQCPHVNEPKWLSYILLSAHSISTQYTISDKE